MPLHEPLHGLWSELPGELLGLLLPAHCTGCPAGRGRLCPSCRAALAGARPGPTAVTGVHAAAPYADPVRRLLLAHKERGALHLAGPLGAALAGAVRSALGPGGAGAPLLLVPVPSTRASVRARGHDPTLRLARAAARSLHRSGLPASVAPVLRHTRGVADQSGLTAEARRRNLSGALAVPPRLGRRLAQASPRQAAPWRLVLVDDLVTTGASLAEAARALAVAGAPPAAGATVAAAVLRRAPDRSPRPAASPRQPG